MSEHLHSIDRPRKNNAAIETVKFIGTTALSDLCSDIHLLDRDITDHKSQPDQYMYNALLKNQDGVSIDLHASRYRDGQSTLETKITDRNVQHILRSRNADWLHLIQSLSPRIIHSESITTNKVIETISDYANIKDEIPVSLGGSISPIDIANSVVSANKFNTTSISDRRSYTFSNYEVHAPSPIKSSDELDETYLMSRKVEFNAGFSKFPNNIYRHLALTGALAMGLSSSPFTQKIHLYEEQDVETGHGSALMKIAIEGDKEVYSKNQLDKIAYNLSQNKGEEYAELLTESLKDLRRNLFDARS